MLNAFWDFYRFWTHPIDNIYFLNHRNHGKNPFLNGISNDQIGRSNEKYEYEKRKCCFHYLPDTILSVNISINFSYRVSGTYDGNIYFDYDTFERFMADETRENNVKIN